MLKVCFAGVTGWTAPPIMAAIDAADDLVLTSGVSRSAAGEALAAVTASSSDGSVHSSVSEALRSADVDVLVDYTSASAVRENVRTAVEAGVHVVVGSSGLTARRLRELDRLARERGVGVVAAATSRSWPRSCGVPPLWPRGISTGGRSSTTPAPRSPTCPAERRANSPRTLGQAKEPKPAVPIAELHGPIEARGAEVAGTRIHSMRLPGFVVSTEIVFGGPGERLTIRHDPGQSPLPYVDGTLLAIRQVAQVPGVRRGLDSLLFPPDSADG
jgi:4-hydroxy-tetrahydrodipicolinate reductase